MLSEGELFWRAWRGGRGESRAWLVDPSESEQEQEVPFHSDPTSESEQEREVAEVELPGEAELVPGAYSVESTPLLEVPGLDRSHDPDSPLAMLQLGVPSGIRWRRTICSRLGCGPRALTLQRVNAGDCLEASTVHAGMLQLASQANALGVLYLTPLATFILATSVTEEELANGSNLLEYNNLVANVHASLALVAVMQALGHYTLVVCTRQQLSAPWRIEYTDSLATPSAHCQAAMSRMLEMLDFMEPNVELPCVSTGEQQDSWSGGLWALAHLEVALHRMRGCYDTCICGPEAMASRLNTYLEILRFCFSTDLFVYSINIIKNIILLVIIVLIFHGCCCGC